MGDRMNEKSIAAPCWLITRPKLPWGCLSKNDQHYQNLFVKICLISLSLEVLNYAYLIAMYRQTASVTVSEIEIVCRTCENCMWKKR